MVNQSVGHPPDVATSGVVWWPHCVQLKDYQPEQDQCHNWCRAGPHCEGLSEMGDITSAYMRSRQTCDTTGMPYRETVARRQSRPEQGSEAREGWDEQWVEKLMVVTAAVCPLLHPLSPQSPPRGQAGTPGPPRTPTRSYRTFVPGPNPVELMWPSLVVCHPSPCSQIINVFAATTAQYPSIMFFHDRSSYFPQAILYNCISYHTY